MEESGETREVASGYLIFLSTHTHKVINNYTHIFKISFTVLFHHSAPNTDLIAI